MGSGKLLLIVSALYLLVSCKEEKMSIEEVNQIPGLGGDAWTPGAIDKWIYDSLTVPYNISVKYKWDQAELDFDKTVVPPKEEKVIPLMSAMKKAWLSTYAAEAGDLFVKKLAPKFFNLVGSGSYNLDGSVTQGVAEGGRKVILYQTNYFRSRGMPGFLLADSNVTKEMFLTMHHEFGHILHMNILYPPEYTRISKALYTSDWINYNTAEAYSNGFISSYAMSKPDDDFVEMIAIMLTEGKSGFDKIVNQIPAGTSALGVTDVQAKKNLRDKEAAIVSYFKQAWKIDFYSLQTRTRAAISSLIY